MREALSAGGFSGAAILALLVPLAGLIIGGLSVYWHFRGEATKDRGLQGIWLVLLGVVGMALWALIP